MSNTFTFMGVFNKDLFRYEVGEEEGGIKEGFKDSRLGEW